MKNDFKPAWWLPGPHLQTLWPSIIRRNKNITLQRERFELPDGDFIDVDWGPQKSGPIILVLHGLEGSVRSHYAQGMLSVFNEHGWRSGVMHFRSCSGEVNRLPRMYHSGDTHDLAAVIETIKQKDPGVPIAIVGFSMGGNVLLKWLGESTKNNFIAAAVAVSVPFELNKAVDHIGKGFSRIYEKHLLNCLLQKVSEKFNKQNSPIDFPKPLTLKTIRQFDDAITAPLHGFESAEDYYIKSSSRQFLKKIRIPTLLLQAKDDPFMPHTVIPDIEELSPSITLEVTRSGGHVGFVSGSIPWKPKYWLEERIPIFLQHFF